MRILRSSAVVLMLGACSVIALSAASHAQVSISVTVDVAPPPLPIYEQPPIPGDGYFWVPGYWAWDQAQADYYWVPATWALAPEPDLLWTPGYWDWRDGFYVFNQGYWAPQVGFYGGINYCYGYTGRGYEGGRWEHGAFFYNRAVNNVTNVNIKNVYEQAIVVNNTTNNVSYNGGKGGTEARPTPQEQAAAKERHIEATALQKQHAEAASKNRSLFLKDNHGEPAVAATPRPGVFEGAGVSHASHATKINGEAPKPEPKAEAPKPEPKAEAPKPEPKAEAPKPEPKAEAPKPEPKAEAPKPEPKAEAPKSKPKAEAPKPKEEKKP